MKWVIEFSNGYMGVFSAKTEKAAERKAKQIVIERFFGCVRPAEESDLESLRAMGGTEMD